MKKIYGIPIKTSGVYLITNKTNGKKYVGSSVDVPRRLATHFGRDAKRYLHHPFYKDIRECGREAFQFELLECCEREKLIEREQYYFDSLHPEYNVIRPTECSFTDPTTQAHRMEAQKNIGEKLKERYNTKEYKELFSRVQDERKKPVRMKQNGVTVAEFQSMSDAQKWLNENTEFVGKNKVSKIKAVCDGARKSAFGFTFEYIECVETIPKGSTPPIGTAVEAVGTGNS